MIAVLRQTFRDLYRERILYNVFFFSLFLILVGYLAALLVYGHQDRVMIDFGTSVISMSIVVVSMTVGARLLRTEIEQRTIYLPLVRPLSRVHYFSGKSLGALLFILTNLLGLSLVLMVAIHYSGGQSKLALLQWAWLTGVEATLVFGLAVALSFFVRPGLTAMLVLAFLFLSHNHDQLMLIQKQADDSKSFFTTLINLTPDGTAFFLDTRVYYDQALELSEFALRMGYGLLWAAAFLVLANAVFFRRNL